MSVEELKSAVENGDIDTVVIAQTDMQGRLMGKRLHAHYFLDNITSDFHCCNYLLTVDMEMTPVPGYHSANWENGYGDYAMRPDLATLRKTPWLDGTALVLCDVLNKDGSQEISMSPRAVLKRQIARLGEMGYCAFMGSELEFFIFKESFEEAAEKKYKDLHPISTYNEDYHIFQTTKEEHVTREIRNGLYEAGVPIEGSKGEACAGQAEINVCYDNALSTADNHVIIKNACKEIAWCHNRAITFMAKWNFSAAGSSSHIHQSLRMKDGDAPAFYSESEPFGMSKLMRSFLAGQLAHASEATYFLAPNINSYKRFQMDTFAPTNIVWSLDNRTAAFRVCGENSKSIRIECRVGGGDLNPYLAFAALIAAGIDGIEQGMDLMPEHQGNAYAAESVPRIPTTLREAAGSLRDSKLLRSALGNDVVDHYFHAAEWEQDEFERQVTGWELARGFERS